MPKTYNRNIPYSKFFNTSRVGSEKYNPTITISYNATDDAVRIEEEFGGETWVQTISGSASSGTVSYTVTYAPWELV